MRILIVVDQRCLRGWIPRLAGRLSALGHELAFRSVEPVSGSASAGLGLLERMEARLIGARAGNAWVPVGLATLNCRAANAVDGTPDLTLDFSQTGGSLSEGVVLTPLYDGSIHEEHALLALLDGRAPTLGLRRSDGIVILHGLPAVENRDFLIRAFDQILCRIEAICLQAVHLHGENRTPVTLHGEPGAHETKPSITATRAVAVLASEVAEKCRRRLLRAMGLGAGWKIGFRQVADEGLWTRPDWDGTPFEWLPDDGKRYFADPFIMQREGRSFVFCEEVPVATGKGIISYFELELGRPVAHPTPVLEEAEHLSYPFVFEYGGDVWMISELAASRTVSLYRADPFPSRWTKEAVLLENIIAADATLTHDGENFWLFASLQDPGTSSWDALGLFYSPALHGPWKPHPLNPVLLDASASRPAGQMIRRGGVLYRPAQDCTQRYGYGLAFARVETLDPERAFTQVVESRIVPPAGGLLNGIHTVNRAGQIEVIDALVKRRPWTNRG